MTARVTWRKRVGGADLGTYRTPFALAKAKVVARQNFHVSRTQHGSTTPTDINAGMATDTGVSHPPYTLALLLFGGNPAKMLL
jgi:hypothetical protein